MGEQNTGWRDIKTDPPLEGAKVLLLAGDFAFAGFVCDGEAVASGSPFGTTVWDASHWQPLPPPPGEEVESEKDAAIAEAVHAIENLKGSLEVMRQGVARRDEDIEALQARCDELEPAAKTMLAHLVAAVSVIERSEESGNHPSCAYGSDTMYQMAMKDFHRCMEAGRKALRSVVDGGE